MSPALDQVTIREFEPGDETAFRQLNEEWITHYFEIEAKDAEVINDPQSNILALGGRVFFAVLEGRCVGCCALIPTGPGEFEVAKMAVTETSRGMGIGRRILNAVVDAARSANVRKLSLETNHALSNAMHLYESIGFRHVTPGHTSGYVRADVFMEMALDTPRP